MAPHWTTPEHVRRRHAELLVYLVQRALGLLVGDRSLVRLAPDDALNTHVLHQSGDCATGDIEAFPIQLTPDLAYAIDAPVFFEDKLDLGPQHCVAPGAIRQSGRIGPLRQVIVVGGRGDRPNPADRLDPVLPSLIVDETNHHFYRRSSSALAKYALALRRISLA